MGSRDAWAAIFALVQAALPVFGAVMVIAYSMLTGGLPVGV